MRLSPLWLVVVPALAKPHRHGHRHMEGLAKREPIPMPAVELVPGPTATVITYLLDGKEISEYEVRQGIANGSLVWDDDGAPSSAATVNPKPTATPVAVAPVASSAIDRQPVQPSHAEPAPSSPPIPSAKPDPVASPSNSNGVPNGIDREFPSNTLSCGNFPEGYGAEQVKHMGLGGWAGVQDPQYDGADGYDRIVTAVDGSCEDGACCKPGAFCSYSCPDGYLKASWPKKQGKTRQSVGGLFCNKDNKLEMPDGSIAKTLCYKGTDKISVTVQNKLSKSVSICRTDYPGTEGETLPTTVGAGETAPLACPDDDIYYHWPGSPDATSAQYYVNKQGVSEGEACRWGDGSKAIGNWAPLIFGAGYQSSQGFGYFSLAQNMPTTYEDLDFTVEIIADWEGGLHCRYSKGMYCKGVHYEQCVGKSGEHGCTMALKSGNVTVLFTENN